MLAVDRLSISNPSDAQSARVALPDALAPFPTVRPYVRTSVRPFFLFLRVCSTDFDRMLHSHRIPSDRALLGLRGRSPIGLACGGTQRYFLVHNLNGLPTHLWTHATKRPSLSLYGLHLRSD